MPRQGKSQPTMRTDVPAEVAAVLEDLTADAALIDPLVLPQLLYQLPPNPVSTGENETSFEGHGVLVMSKPTGLERKAGTESYPTGCNTVPPAGKS